jgi:heterodisulfide reductase subunit C
MPEAIRIEQDKKSGFMDTLRKTLPDAGNLNLCLTCGACASGCPATGLENMDLRKFVRKMNVFTLDPIWWMSIFRNRER